MSQSSSLGTLLLVPGQVIPWAKWPVCPGVYRVYIAY
jgi:hypothetical protein